MASAAPATRFDKVRPPCPLVHLPALTRFILRTRPTLLAALLVCLGLSLCAPHARAQQPAPEPANPAARAPAATAPTQPPPLPPETLEPIARLSASIESAEKSIQQLKELEGELSRLRGDVEHIIYDSTAAAEALRPQLAEVRSQIEKLGPPPAKDQHSESATVATERARLNAMAAALDGAVKTSELAWVRAKQLIDRITVMRYQLFTRNLFERRDSPLLPAVWNDVSTKFDAVLGRVRYYGGDWLGWANQKSAQVWGLGLGALALFAGLDLLVRRTAARSQRSRTPPPSFFARVLKASWIAPARMLPLAAAATLVFVGLNIFQLLFAPWDGVGVTLLKGLLVYAATSALLQTALAPRAPAWRLVPVSDGTALRLLWSLRAFVAVYVLDTVLVEFGRAIYAPLAVTVTQAFLTSVLFAGLLGLLLLSHFRPQTGPDRPVNGHVHVPGPVSRFAPVWIKFPLWLMAVLILTSSVLGYVALGRFAAHQLVLSGMVLGAAGLVYLAIRALTRGRGEGTDVLGAALETQFGLEPARRRQLTRLIEALLLAVVVLLTVPALLIQWGFSSADIRDWVHTLFFGFEIGALRISPVRILLGIGLFTALLFLTRLGQRWLRDRVLAQPRMDPGIANSVDTAIGYSGITLSVLLAVSYAGLDVTNLAIVAGALSVGIGFGLQSIVNNFVSGLILLVERPIKVGDWIVVGTEQGNVRRISVRSTEIETFDRASLIIPNSELIMGRVLNWTHRNLLGRTMLKITVDANADPERVLLILRACADAHPDVLQTPEPNVSFDNFSGNGLEFTLRVTLADVTRGGPVSTELRTAILKSLREARVVMSNPQFDVHLRDLDFVKGLVQRIAEQRPQSGPTDLPTAPARTAREPA